MNERMNVSKTKQGKNHLAQSGIEPRSPPDKNRISEKIVRPGRGLNPGLLFLYFLVRKLRLYDILLYFLVRELRLYDIPSIF